MNEGRSALFRRFRANLEARAQAIASILATGEAAVAGTAELLGELHTLKGEARMLGMGELAALVHAVEDRFVDSADLDLAAIRAVWQAVLKALAATTPEATRTILLRTAMEACGAVPPEREEEDGAPLEGSSVVAETVEQARGRRWVQVDATIVDDLCESLAAVVAAMGQLESRLEVLQGASTAETRTARELALDAARARSRLEEGTLLAWSLRLAPIEPTLVELAHHLRSLADEQGKRVRVVVRASGVEVEREVLKQLWDPLLHACRNALDHGIEAPEDRASKSAVASIELGAESRGAYVLVHVRDDGPGVDHDAVVARAVAQGLVASEAAASLSEQDVLALLFRPGFSTRTVADGLSGRGVGLDVVKRQIEALGGSVSIETKRGQGTEFALLVPAAITREKLFVFRADEITYALSARLVLAVDKVPEASPDVRLFAFRGRVLPRRSWRELFGGARVEEESRLVVLNLAGREFALTLPHVLGEYELLRRPLGRLLSGRSGVTASATLRDGRLVLILDPEFLKEKLGERGAVSSRAPEISRQVRRVLVADDSPVVRDLIAEVLTSSGYEVTTARNGREALQLLEELEPGLIVSDVEMPEMDGFELLRAVRRRSALLPVILLTARGSTEDRRRAAAGGANAFVAKGEYKSENLVEVVDRFYPRTP